MSPRRQKAEVVTLQFTAEVIPPSDSLLKQKSCVTLIFWSFWQEEAEVWVWLLSTPTCMFRVCTCSVHALLQLLSQLSRIRLLHKSSSKGRGSAGLSGQGPNYPGKQDLSGQTLDRPVTDQPAARQRCTAAAARRRHLWPHQDATVTRFLLSRWLQRPAGKHSARCWGSWRLIWWFTLKWMEENTHSSGLHQLSEKTGTV